MTSSALLKHAQEWAERNGSRFPVEHLAKIYAVGFSDGTKRFAVLERTNKMLRTMLQEAGWVEGREVIRIAMCWHENVLGLGTLNRACARLDAKRKAMRAK